MSARTTSQILVSALIRAVEAAGGSGMVLARGDATAGAILLAIAERGETRRLLERALDPMTSAYRWIECGPKAIDEPGALGDYIDRRRRSDPDIWVVELDSADAEAIAADMLG